jgi:cysteine desulfurase family protein (TIGR01976 family)
VATTDAIRAHFPALSRVHHDHPVAYFDGPGGTQVPDVVVEAMSDYLYHHNANTHWRYPTSVETDHALLGARRAVADFLNADPTEIAFGANMTTLTFHLGRALGRQWGPGDDVVVTELDHRANVDPWRWLEKDRGITVRTAAMDVDAGELDWADLECAITPRTKLVAIGAASNALGTITDVARAAAFAKAAGALVFVDAVHYAPHALVDVRQLGCDFLACSAYKFYGPHEGILYGRRDLLDAIDFPRLGPAPDRAPGARARRAGAGWSGHSQRCTRAAKRSSSVYGTASSRSRASPSTARRRGVRARRRLPSPSLAARPTRSRPHWSHRGSSSRTAISTPRP